MRNPPKHLSDAARKWFRETAKQFEFETSAEWELLTQAAGCLHRIEQARAAIEEHGLCVPTAADGVKPNPACGIERDNRILFSRIVRELRLNDNQTDDETRPPRLR